MGYGYEDFKEINPRIIYCSGSGYGESGPYVTAPRPGHADPGLTGIAAATGRGDGPAGAGRLRLFRPGRGDEHGLRHPLRALLAGAVRQGQEIKVDLLTGMLAHQGQEMLMVMNFGVDFKRPNSGIGHPGMDAPFGVYPTSDGWVTIAMSPYTKLVGVLGDDSLARLQRQDQLFEKRDEIWEKIAALTKPGRRRT